MYGTLQKALIVGVAYTAILAEECSIYISGSKYVIDSYFQRWPYRHYRIDLLRKKVLAGVC